MNLIIKPKITIATVVYNDVNGIEETILSVLGQDYLNIEYIIIDGISTDGTIDIIRKYSDNISLFVSESDSGVYDAMNKATYLSSGDWILFLNSSDKLFDQSVISNVVKHLDKNKECELLRGDIIASRNGIESLITKRSINMRWFGLPHSHQAQLVTTRLAKCYPFMTKFKISADLEFFMRVTAMSIRISDYPNVIAICDFNKGLSKNVNPIRLYRDALRIKLTHFDIIGLIILLIYVPVEFCYILIGRFINISKKIYTQIS